jgi:hypothetical protein
MRPIREATPEEAAAIKAHLERAMPGTSIVLDTAVFAGSDVELPVSPHDEALRAELNAIDCSCPYHQMMALTLKMQLGDELTQQDMETATHMGYMTYHEQAPDDASNG